MKIDQETLNSCDMEPIHLPGAIQRFGCLVVTDACDRIVQVSSNIAEWLGVAPSAALGYPLGEVFGTGFAESLKELLASDAYRRGLVLEGPPGLNVVVTAHQFGPLTYLEFEAPADERSGDLGVAHRLLASLREANTSSELVNVAARDLKMLSGFDRVMVYRFDDDGHGQVVAEAVSEGLEPFLGLHYPAADIPKQARRMYLAQRIRYIADVGYEAVPMLGLAQHQAPVDMTHCALRSISPVHIQYLQNMGVGATLAMSLIVGDRLWGMIVCHHGGRVLLSPQHRALCDHISQLMSILLATKIRSENMAARLGRQSLIAALSERLLCGDRITAALIEKPHDLLALAAADGAYVRIGGEVHIVGVTPTVEGARQLLSAMQGGQSVPTASIALGEDHPDLFVGEAAGALAIPIAHNPEDGIIWFRQEVVRSVDWGGDPAQFKAADGEQLTPRKSFAAWRAIVSGRSLPWDDADFAMARELRRLITAALLRQTEQQLALLSRYDPLTGLENRRALSERLASLEAQANPAAALLFLDLDRFKTVNDSLGHSAGDALLIQVAERLRCAVRSGDAVARLGGDEFVVLLDGADERTARATASRILDVFRGPFLLDDRPYRAKASIGLAITPAVRPADMMRAADTAMYAAKRSGGSGLLVYEEQLHAEMVDRLSLEQDLFVALERGQLFLAYQPIVDATSKEIVGVEALLRWRHPERGLVSPVTFIPLAEDSKLMTTIGSWVMEKAVATVSGWNRRFGLDLFVSVNVAPQQLAQPDCVRVFGEALARLQAPPGMLVLEVTESTMMDRSAVARLLAMQRLGIGIAIDDFGTGYSNIAYLRDLPADKVKIDRRFVAAAGVSDDDRALLAAMVALARTIRMTVVAEGVETEAESEAVRAVGCDMIQGFLFGRPEAEETIAEWLASAVDTMTSRAQG